MLPARGESNERSFIRPALSARAEPPLPLSSSVVSEVGAEVRLLYMNGRRKRARDRTPPAPTLELEHTVTRLSYDRKSLSLPCRISISSMMLVAAPKLTTSLEVLLWMLLSVVHTPESAWQC